MRLAGVCGPLARLYGATDMDKKLRFRREMLRWSRRHPRAFPWRDSRDPYAVLVGELLLQRTRGENVVAPYREFLRRWPTPERLAGTRVASIASVIRPLGLAKRAPILKRLGRAIVSRGGVPDSPEDLDELPGVGPYAAHAVPVFVQGRTLPLADQPIGRVLRRYFGLPAQLPPKDDRGLWAFAEELAAPGRARELWLGTLDFAAAVCKPRPLCPECPLRASCSFWEDQRRRQD
jgi:A/G-specific adenine glycosylase